MTPTTHGKKSSSAIQLSARDLQLLPVIAEQLTNTQPQLARLIDRTEHTARWLRQRWQRAGWVESRVLLVGEPVLMWLTPRGLRACGSDFKRWRPEAIASLRHLVAVTDVRLHVAERSPDGVWVSERLVRRAAAVSGECRRHLPDAEVLIGDRRVAIEVELTQKERGRTETIAFELLARYDAVWYFAPPSVHRHLQRALRRTGFERVQLHELFA